MKLSQKDQQSLVQLLARLSDEIYGIEEQYRLIVSQADLRPRIDYFHDAIRAYTTAMPSAEQETRLAIEYISYDVQAMRYLSENPLASLNEQAGLMSPRMDLVKKTPPLVATAKRPDRNAKERLSELYKQYGMIFAALLKPVADRDFKDRTERGDEEVVALNNTLQAVKNHSNDELAMLIHQLGDGELQSAIASFIQQTQGKQKISLPKLIALIKNRIKKVDTELAKIDKAHLHYSTGQLAIYEASKDLLKKMVASGMNIVGTFVEESVRRARMGSRSR